MRYSTAGLKCGSATDIAHVPESWCEKVIRDNLNLPEVDAIVQGCRKQEGVARATCPNELVYKKM